MSFLLGYLALFGLAIGSFVNVVAYRVPLGESVVSPGSHCPRCDAPIARRHNVPVLGWLILRGRCASCRAGISVRYPLVEAVTAALFVAVGWRAVRMDLPEYIPALLAFTGLGIALALVDLDVKRLPDVMVLPSYPVLFALLGAAAVVSRDYQALERSLVAGAVLFACYFALALAYPGGMGFGDVKLSGLIGLLLGYLSWRAVLVGTFAAFLLGALTGLAVIAARRGDRKTALPFGPFMVAGALAALWLG